MEKDVFITQAFHTNPDDQRMEKILLLQRLIRSYYVRRQFEDVRKEYLKTLTDIEGEMAIKPVESHPIKVEEPLKQTIAVLPSKEELLRKREEIAIELLWMEQAIQSRKDYLRLKSRYTSSIS
ncbi:unnamed protein product [Adineta ricciae]|uniref:Uncharacterized protein n=1 Tax=Adineta ricciae TaxID=249248 RepID=A0A814WS23_ADIRI|nr:unnamed protein product [Adineta ricciae]